MAVRSEEPYRLQGYSILKSLSAPDYISDPDVTGELLHPVFLACVVQASLQLSVDADAQITPVLILCPALDAFRVCGAALASPPCRDPLGYPDA